MFEILLVFGLAILLGFPLGHYLAAVMRGAPMRGDRLFGLVEQPIYKLLGLSVAKGVPSQSMPLKHYVSAFLISNLVIGFIVWLLLMTQAWLPLNPNAAPNMSWDLALHTMVSFLTNTNQQHYSGQAQLSYLAQMTGIVGLQVITPMMGLAMVVATLRALFSKQSHDNEGSSPVLVGNYWADIIRPAVRFFLPLGLVFSVLLNSQGVPATFSGGPVAQPVEASSEFKEQKIPLGPVAPMVAVKQLGTNGGGWYGPNSAVPLENPTPFSNVLEMLAIILIPVSVVFMLGAFTGRKKFAALVFGCMLTMSVISTAVAVWSESFSGVAHSLASMEGKEVRFGSTASALWAAITTQTSNGSVNMMHDSAAPLTGLVTLSNMLINAIWGGIGCGLQQFMVYLMLTVFVAGLMTGRTPELFGRKIEAPEVRLLAVLILLQPIVILGFTAVTLAIPAITGNSNPSFHGISQVFYEYVSAFANNGSGFEGLGDATVWWNVSCSIVLALGRYPALIIPLVIAVMLANKRLVPEGNGSLKVETPTFALTLIAVVVILTLLQFMPVLVLGPIADHLILSAQSALPAA
jgi:K+-transporting ATPase ATPase A chain